MGRRLGGETGAKQVSFQEGCGRGTISYLEGERFTKKRDIVTKGIREVFV